MEMCYNDALVMPNSFDIINEEEMTYIDGGKTVTVTFSRDFLRDCVTAGLSGACAAIAGAIGTLGTPVVGAVCAAFGAALGWVVGGSISRAYIKSDQSIRVWIPFRNKDIYIA